MADYHRNPERGLAWGGPFNGQAQRVQTFKSIVALVQPAIIIETGTYLGTTTELMADTGLPVYTIERDPRNFGFARARLRQKPNVMLRLGDSRTELRALFDGPLRSARGEKVFVYLDAHWDADLPLCEEVDIVFHCCPAAMIMIDDFQVPDDPGYGYDDYGSDKALTPAYIARSVARHQLSTFYPSTTSVSENGARRGFVILAKDAIHSSGLASCRFLRAAPR